MDPDRRDVPEPQEPTEPLCSPPNRRRHGRRIPAQADQSPEPHREHGPETEDGQRPDASANGWIARATDGHAGQTIAQRPEDTAR